VPPAADGWAAFVLTGGRSRRMGSDKATLVLDGVPLAERVARACEEAGAVAVAFGGARPGLAALGRPIVEDEPAGVGPVGGVAAGLSWCPASWCLVVACDLVAPDPAVFRSLAAARRPGAEVVVPVVDGVRQVLVALWRVDRRQPVDTAVAGGVRAVRDLLTGVVVEEVHGLPAAALADADRPAELPDRRPG
jgi:molybdenum cofactor guanylyltransferase